MTRIEKCEAAIMYLQVTIATANASDDVVKFLRKELRVQEKIKEELLKQETTVTVLNELPTRVRNALGHLFVKTDSELEEFLRGDFDNRISFLSKRNKNPIGRLFSLRNVGPKSLEEAVEVLKKCGLI